MMFLCQSAIGVALLLHQSNLALLLTTQAVFGTARAFSSPASAGVVKELVPAAELQRANSLLSVSRDTLLIIAPVTGGVLVALASSGVALLVSAIAFAVAGAILARLRLPGSLVRPESKFLADLRDGWHEFRSRRWVWGMVTGAMVYQATVLPAIFVLGPVLALRNGLGTVGWAVVLGAQAAGAVVGGLVVMAWTPSRPLLVTNALVGLESAFLIALALHASSFVVIALAAVGTAGAIASDTLFLTILQREIDEQMISRVISYDWLGSLALAPVGFAVMGLVSGAADLADVLIGIAVLNLVVRAVLMAIPDFWTLRLSASEPG
jgi:MFS family permease